MITKSDEDLKAPVKKDENSEKRWKSNNKIKEI